MPGTVEGRRRHQCWSPALECMHRRWWGSRPVRPILCPSSTVVSRHSAPSIWWSSADKRCKNFQFIINKIKKQRLLPLHTELYATHQRPNPLPCVKVLTRPIRRGYRWRRGSGCAPFRSDQCDAHGPHTVEGFLVSNLARWTLPGLRQSALNPVPQRVPIFNWRRRKRMHDSASLWPQYWPQSFYGSHCKSQNLIQLWSYISRTIHYNLVIIILWCIATFSLSFSNKFSLENNKIKVLFRKKYIVRSLQHRQLWCWVLRRK